jgi:hypothetical protein
VADPVPVGPIWLTGVYGVRGLASPPAGIESGPYRIPPVATNVAQAVEPKNSGAVSPTWLTAQFSSGEMLISDSGPGDVIWPVPAAWTGLATIVNVPTMKRSTPATPAATLRVIPRVAM